MQVGVRLPTQRISIRNPTSNVDLDENSIPLTKVKNLDIKKLIL